MKLNQNNDLMNFYLCEEKADVFKDSVFSNTAEIHKYFSSDKKPEDYEDKYEALNSIIDCFADLRAIAEEVEKNNPNEHVINVKKEIPLDYEYAINYFYYNTENKEPPLRLICRIAEENFNVIDKLSKGLHKVLRRERDFVPVARAQQIDVQCIRWLSRQPGRTTYERAGNKQKILSIVRYESVDTLENRVFKQFLKLCIINCDSYIHDYSNIDIYKDSSRIKSVRRLRNLAIYALNQPEFESISNLTYIPKPNYVLQNNAFYRVIWNLYLDLLHRTRLIECLWSNRDVVLYELVKMLYLIKFHKHANVGDSNIRHEFWIRQFTDTEGSFFCNTNWNYLDCDFNKSITYNAMEQRKLFLFKELGNGRVKSKAFRVAFLPDYYSDTDYKYSDMVPCILFTEEIYEKDIPGTFKIRLTGNIIHDISTFLDIIVDGVAYGN